MDVLANGARFDLGQVETGATVGIIDYSRRVTDDFGVTTVTQRGFARRLSVRLAVPVERIDAVQRRLADLRATSAQWIADDRFAWLSPTGFYKDFEIDLAVPPVSYCRLTIEGLAQTDIGPDLLGDPAPEGLASTLQLLQPATVTEAVLAASSVPEADAPIWSAQTGYLVGARVLRQHRIYEALVAHTGTDPLKGDGKWLAIGPSNRWAMFDQALGTLTTAQDQVAVTLVTGGIEGVALLDVSATTVRVQAAGYDRTQQVTGGAVTFLDLGGKAQVTVTIAGPGAVSVGTVLVGRIVQLGTTEASPTASINDFSRKTVDDFGEVSITRRAYAKRMAAKALIRTDAVDLVANRIAAVRAVPALWIGQDGVDSLTIYGFFRDFEIEVGEQISKLSLSVEGFSAAEKAAPLVDWEDLGDRNGRKPKDNADKTSENTAKDTKAVGGRPVQKVIADLDAVNKDLSDALTRFDGFADDLSNATADLEGVFQSVALLSPAVFDVAQMLATSNAYLRARTTIDGMPIGSVVVETREKTDTMVEDMRLLGTRSLNGGAFQLDLSRVMVDGRTSLSQRLRQIEAKGEGDLNARATDLISTIVENGKATATRFSTLEATAKGVSAKMSTLEEVTASANKATAKRLDAIDLALDTPGTGVKASIKDLTEATLTGDGAIIKRVGVIESSLNTAGTGVWARIGKAEQTIIAQDKAFAESIETINAAIYSPQGGLSAQVAFLRTATVDAQKGVEAKAVLALNANGHVAGLVATNTGKVSKVTFTFDQSQWAKPDGTLLFRIGSVEAGEDPNAVYAPSLVVDTIKVGSVGTDALAVNAIRKVYAVELGSNPALPGTSGQRINYLTLYVKKSLAESALRISYNMRPRPGRDYAAQFVLGRMPVGSDEKTDMDVQWFWGASAVINGFRSLRQPMNLSRTFDGIPAGEHLIIVDVIAYGGGNDQGFMEAGSNLYVEEVKR